jgi:hypothetical protein
MAPLTRTKRQSWIYWLIVLTAFITAAGITGSAQAQNGDQGKKGLKVTVLLYSGRSNPSYVLEDKESIDKMKNLIGKSKAIEKFEKETVVPSILGYNGVVVENLDATVEQFPASLNIFKGNVEVKNDRKKFLKDEGNAIEDFLLTKAMERKVIDDNALRKIKAGK